MRIRALLTAFAVIPALVASAGMASASQEQLARDCPEKMIFEVGGHRDPNADIYNESNERLPAGVAFTKVRYPAQIWPYPGDTISLDDAVDEGVGNLDRAVREFHEFCAGSHITISGYSQGAIVAGDVLGDLSRTDAIPHSLINGVLYSDARRPGVNDGPGGIMTNLPTVIPGMTMRGPRGFGDLQVKEICKKNDGICHSENVITNFVCFVNGIVGYLDGDHRYDIDPHNVSGGGDELIDQEPRIPGCGPPLPIKSPTLHELFNGDRDAAKRAVTGVRDRLPQDVRRRLDRFPWLAVETPGA